MLQIQEVDVSKTIEIKVRLWVALRAPCWAVKAWKIAEEHQISRSSERFETLYLMPEVFKGEEDSILQGDRAPFNTELVIIESSERHTNIPWPMGFQHTLASHCLPWCHAAPKKAKSLTRLAKTSNEQSEQCARSQFWCQISSEGQVNNLDWAWRTSSSVPSTYLSPLACCVSGELV